MNEWMNCQESLPKIELLFSHLWWRKRIVPVLRTLWRLQRQYVLVYTGHLCCRWKGITKSYPVFSGWNSQSLVIRNNRLQVSPSYWHLFPGWASLHSCMMPQIFLACLSFPPSATNQHIPSRVSSLFRSQKYFLSETPSHITKTWKYADIKKK